MAGSPASGVAGHRGPPAQRAATVDSVGSTTLATAIRQTRYRGPSPSAGWLAVGTSQSP